jgi:hypothetical protein
MIAQGRGSRCGSGRIFRFNLSDVVNPRVNATEYSKDGQEILPITYKAAWPPVRHLKFR